MNKKYTLFAGVNGAGKTSMYKALYVDSESVGFRINTDEMVSSRGSWKDNKLQIQAGKEAVRLIHTYIKEGSTFHQETTLAGRSILRTIELAKIQGFYVTMNYIGVATPEIAKERIRSRVSQGGHGIKDEVVEKRYYKSLEHLNEAVRICDEVHIYDNSVQMKQIIYVRQGKIIWQDDKIPEWIDIKERTVNK